MSSYAQSKSFVINHHNYDYNDIYESQEFSKHFINSVKDTLKQGISITKLKMGGKKVTKKVWKTIDTFYTLGYPYDIDEAYDVVFNPTSSHAIFVNSQVEVIRDLLQRDAEMTVNSVFTKVTISLQNIDFTNPCAKELVTDIYLIYNKLQLKHL